MQRLSRHSLRFALSGLLITLIALMAFGGKAYAVPPVACDSVTPSLTVNSTTTTGSCTMSLAIEPLSTGDLTATLPGAVTLGDGTVSGTLPAGNTNGHITGTGGTGGASTYLPNGGSQNFNLSFNTTVVDDRAVTTGWNLEAQTTNTLPTGYSVVFNSVTPTCTLTLTTACSALVTPGFPITLSADPQEFIGAHSTTDSTANIGHWTIATLGTLTLPGNIPSGTLVNAGLTITLNDSAYTP